MSLGKVLGRQSMACEAGVWSNFTGGWLYQMADSLKPEEISFTTVSEAQPTPEQLEDLKFAWRSVKHVKSNAITIAKEGRLLGMGSGQPNRVKSVEIAIEKAGGDIKVCLLALLSRPGRSKNLG